MGRRAWTVLFVLLLGACADAPSGSAAETTPPDSLEIRCDGQTTEVLTPIVQARRDGVHVLIHNTSAGERLSVTWEGGGDGASPGDTTLIFPIDPGRSRIRCMKETEDNAMENGDWGPFEVLAPDGWVSPAVDCPGASYQGVGDFAEGARGVTDPLADAPKHFREQGDRVVQAGYATSEKRTLILLRDDVAVAGLVYISDGYGGWLQSESYGCSD